MLLPSDRIRRGEVRRLRRFGEELVVFRGEDGTLAVTDAHCPHLGADLGGGTVVGDTLRCPFHGFRFDASGRCVHVPTCERIPKKLQLRAWPVREARGAVFLWWSPTNARPSGDVPRIDEAEDDAWLRPTFVTTEVTTDAYGEIDVAVDRLVRRDAPITMEAQLSRHTRSGLEALTATFSTPIDEASVAVTLMICFKKPDALARVMQRFFARKAVA